MNVRVMGRRMLWRISVLGVVLLGTAFALGRLAPEHSFPNSLLIYLPQSAWPVMPAALLVVSVIGRWRGLIALNLTALAFAALALASFEFATGSYPEEAADGSMRIVTWNVHEEAGHADEIRAELLSMDPDVICLQEARNPAFVRLLPGWNCAGAYDLVIYTREPMLTPQVFGRRGTDARPWLACEVDGPGGRLAVLNAHLSSSKTAFRRLQGHASLPSRLSSSAMVRTREFETMLRALPTSAPVVLAGDFNTPPRSCLYRLLGQRMTDAFAATRFGLGLTYLWQKRAPAWRIDYVWCGNGVRPLTCTVGPAYPSDHRPVVADVLLPSTRQAD